MNRRQTLCDYFDEDVVIKWSSNGKIIFGLVIESSENATDSEDSDDESDDNTVKRASIAEKWRHLRPGFAKIALYPNGNTIVINESKVKLYDRSLLNGDVVQRLDPKSHKLVPNSEHGFCKSTKIFSAIKILGTNKVIENVDSNHLEMLSNITEDTICLLDSWLGYVKEVNRKITLKCSDGSLLWVYDLDISDFEDLLTERHNNDSEFNRDDYYIGQQLYGPKKDLKNAKWISQSSRMKHLMSCCSTKHLKINVVVEDVTIDNVSINWLFCLSDQSLSKNKVQSSEITNDSVINMNSSKKPLRDAKVGTNPFGDIIRGEAIRRIKCLNYFGKCSLQLGHQCYYTIKPEDFVISFSDWMTKESLRLSNDHKNEKISESEVETNSDLHEKTDHQINESLSSLDMSSKYTKKVEKSKHFSLPIRRVRKKKLFASRRKTPFCLPISTSAGTRLPVEIVATNTRVSVVWQNSLTEEDVPSINLYPVHHIDNHDFFPGDYVVENKDISETFGYGVVQSCDAISRTAKVKWYSVAPDSQSAQFVAQQELSVYDIKDHSDFSFRSGVCVVRMLVTGEDTCDPESRVGQVIDLTSDGMLRCVWLNGQTSLEWPQQLFIIGDYDSDDLWAESDSEFDYSDYNYNESDESWQTDDNQHNEQQTNDGAENCSKPNSEEQNQSLLNMISLSASQLEEWFKNGTANYKINWNRVGKKFLKVLEKAENCLETNSSFNKLPNRLYDKIQELSRRLRLILPFSANQMTQNNGENNEVTQNRKGLESNVPQNVSESDLNVRSFTELLDSLRIEILLNETQATNGETIDKEFEENAVISETNITEGNSQTTDTNVINDSLSEDKGSLIFLEAVPETHKYFYSSIEPKNPKEFLKRTRFEISLLKSALPEGIDVVLFHDRIDLLSVLILGPKGTPYEDGLFVFDIQLPANYPNGPPLVHYISFCSDRLNPNLYENGKVCVSLLGTWSGKGTEVWAPNASNLLQLIISIQGLILVAEPYYNEAGYSKQRGTSIANDNSRLYNEMVVIKLIQSMTKMALSPPQTFQMQIRRHIIGIADRFIERHKNWAKISEICFSKSITSFEDMNNCSQLTKDFILPPFPLLPASHGFCLSLNKAILLFEETLKSLV